MSKPEVTPLSLRDEPITTGNGYTVEEWPEGRTLIITGRWTEEAASALRKGAADGLGLNYAHGFAEGTLEFLPAGLEVRRLDILHRAIADLSPLARLAGSLEDLSIQAHPEAELDLGWFTSLRSVAADWGLIGPTIGSVAHLEAVTTWQFGDGDLHAFRDQFELRQMVLKEAPYLASLSGIGELSELSELQIQLAPQLNDLTELWDLGGSLRVLRLELCRGVDSLDDIAALTKLRFLELGQCGELDSLSPLSGFNELEELFLWGSTQIIDGDLAPLTELPKLGDLRMMNRPNYAPSVSDIEARLLS